MNSAPIEKGLITKKTDVHEHLHPKVSRRRRIWLSIMIVFFCWATSELVMQQMKIWDNEKMLIVRKKVLNDTKKEYQRLNIKINQLKTEDRMMELAHKLGFGQKGEQNYQLPE